MGMSTPNPNRQEAYVASTPAMNGRTAFPMLPAAIVSPTAVPDRSS